MTKHPIVRVRHDVVGRELTVQRIEHVTPNMLRIWAGGEVLDGFISPSPDDHIKIFVPGDIEEIARRDFTPRRFDRPARSLAIDFALHADGPAIRWARAARPGSSLRIGGPRGSTIIPTDFDWWLLVGDESALPAIGRRVEELPAGSIVTTIVAISSPAEEQRFETAARHEAIWVHRPIEDAGNCGPLVAAVACFAPPAGDGFVWIAAEATVARAVRTHMEDKGHPPAWLKASGYWASGKAGAVQRIDT